MSKVTVRQTGSPIRRKKDQRATLIGLGLNKLGRTSTLEDTPSVRGMIAKRALDKGVTEVVFDRGGYIYHGRVKALADAAREAGLNF